MKEMFNAQVQDSNRDRSQDDWFDRQYVGEGGEPQISNIPEPPPNPGTVYI